MFVSALPTAVNVISLIVNLALIVVGFVNIDRCPVRAMIPIWVIVDRMVSIIITGSELVRIYQVSLSTSV